mmetsp:Transcript_21425/g.60866  ORF Transcript_21425/g.60866 Transcript_21425/m.60866 type:complete len:253 (+) Transcript_21425:353-1111(+)
MPELPHQRSSRKRGRPAVIAGVRRLLRHAVPTRDGGLRAHILQALLGTSAGLRARLSTLSRAARRLHRSVCGDGWPGSGPTGRVPGIGAAGSAGAGPGDSGHEGVVANLRLHAGISASGVPAAHLRASLSADDAPGHHFWHPALRHVCSSSGPARDFPERVLEDRHHAVHPRDQDASRWQVPRGLHRGVSFCGEGLRRAGRLQRRPRGQGSRDEFCPRRACIQVPLGDVQSSDPDAESPVASRLTWRARRLG